MTKGAYEIVEKTATELLKTGDWTDDGEIIPEEVMTPSQDDRLELRYNVTVQDLEAMSMKELRKWASDNGFKSKDTDKDELIVELLNEL
jgi:hypothetical protein